MYLHNLDPFIVRFTETFGLRWYGMSYLAGFLAGYLLVRFLIVRGKSPLRAEMVGDFVFWTAAGAIVGGRLGYALFYRPELFLEFRGAFPFWGLLAVHEGGMASHGGITGVVLGAMLFARKYRLPPLHIMDLATLGGALGIGFGRLANFINGELVGRPCETLHAWCVKFPVDLFEASAAQLVKLEAAVAFLGISSSEWHRIIQQGRSAPVIHSLIEQIQSGNAFIASQVAEVLTPRHPYPLYASLLEGFLIFTILWILWRIPRTPGVIAACFLVFYSLGRLLSEEFRLPDAHIGFQLFGLTRGQWLSFVPLLLGIIGLLWFRKHSYAEKLGGWKKAKG